MALSMDTPPIILPEAVTMTQVKDTKLHSKNTEQN